jgi:hypothetical protein
VAHDAVPLAQQGAAKVATETVVDVHLPPAAPVAENTDGRPTAHTAPVPAAADTFASDVAPTAPAAVVAAPASAPVLKPVAGTDAAGDVTSEMA